MACKTCENKEKLDIVYNLVDEARKACAENIDSRYIEGVLQSILILIGEE